MTMFTAVSAVDLSLCDLSTKEDEAKWKGLFIQGLKKVSQKRGQQVHAHEDAFEYLEKLIVQLLGMICNRPYPHTVPDVQDRILRLLPPPIDQWVMDEANCAIKQGRKKADLVFPVDKVHNFLQKDLLLHRVDHNVAVYICAVLEYIATDVLQLVGNYVKCSRHKEFSVQDIKAAMSCDKVLSDLFTLGDSYLAGSMEEPLRRNSLTYMEVAEDFLQSERLYLRDLQMLIKVFREELASKLEQENQNLELVFTAIVDITELTVAVISIIEDNMELTDSNHEPTLGICFLELAEQYEFDVYSRYLEAFSENCRQGLDNMLSQPDATKVMSTAGQGFVEAIKYFFPRLLLEPFYHCMLYFQYTKLLSDLSPSDTDRTSFLQADGIMTSLRTFMEEHILHLPRHLGDLRGRMAGKESKQIAQQKIAELKAQVEGFNDSIGKNCFHEFFYEGELQKLNAGKRPSERHGYLFDGCLFLCKANYRRTSVVTGGPQLEYRLKEFYYMTKVEVRDREDTEESKNLFEIVVKDQSPIVLSCRTREEKSNWMYLLVMLTTKSMLDRLLDRILSDEEKKHPLRLPPKEKYRFAEEDSDSNIVFDKDHGNHFIIKGATLLKLIERLTHHQYSDPNFINTFLTTYRSFCSPNEFLDLLIERYNIPDPDFDSSELELESIHERKMLKRFRKEYVRHVKLRVLNVIKQWATHHFYDFERDPLLLERLENFLNTEDDIVGRNILESVRRSVRKAAENTHVELDRNFAAVRSPPPIEYHIRCPRSEWNVLTLHPIELARQMTLLEFDLYRVVKPSELVGSVWTKKNKEQSSPNLLRMIKHTTNVTRWFERTIVDTENIEERIAVVSRILEVMMVLQELNNFNGVLAVVSAMGSASVHRLHCTFQGVSQRLLKALEEAQDLQNDHYKKYQERLRSINPPCVPFFGMYLSNILHIEEGNRDFLPNSNELINFSKRRKVAEITSEIRQFQYSHYCLSVEPNIREFIENLQPFEPDTSETEISNYLYGKSLEIEPRGVRQPPKFPRRWPDLNLKSPGIKPKNLPGKSHPGPLSSFSSSASLHSSVSRMALDSEMDTSESLSHTPTKTLTPSSVVSTTSPSYSHSDYSIFVPVMIGAVPAAPPLPPLPSAPPLPPRKKQENSPAPVENCTSSRTSVRDSGSSLPPPPLPPRKVSPRTPNAPNPPLPRRGSTTSEILSPTSASGMTNNHSTHQPSPVLPTSSSTSSSPKRLAPKGPPIPHHRSPNGHLNHCGAEHCSRAFVFDHATTHSNHRPHAPHHATAPIVPTQLRSLSNQRVPSVIPETPPQLPPRTSRPP